MTCTPIQEFKRSATFWGTISPKDEAGAPVEIDIALTVVQVRDARKTVYATLTLEETDTVAVYKFQHAESCLSWPLGIMYVDVLTKLDNVDVASLTKTFKIVEHISERPEPTPEPEPEEPGVPGVF